MISLVPKLTVSLNSEGTATVPHLDCGSAHLFGFAVFLLFLVVPLGRLSLAVEDKDVSKFGHGGSLES